MIVDMRRFLNVLAWILSLETPIQMLIFCLIIVMREICDTVY